MSGPERILVIKLGALGDFVYALGAMKAIRHHHPRAAITLLTRKPYETLARDSQYFDEILLDPKPKYNLLDWLDLRHMLNERHFDRVYDLQNNDRTALYFKLFSPRPEWVGVAKDASHRNTDPDRVKFHAFQGLRDNLRLAGIGDVELDTLEWLTSDLSRFALQPPYALIVAGSSPQRPNKRWPWQNFQSLCEALMETGIQPVLIGSSEEKPLLENIAQDLPVLNLAGLTDMKDLAALARGADIAIGNDTGPMHMISMTGCPVVMFFRRDESSIQKHGPQTKNSESFERDDLKDVSVDEVLQAVKNLKR